MDYSTIMKGSIIKKIVIVIVAAIALFLMLYFASLPGRKGLANKYYQNGDNFLLEKKYLSASVEYKKSEYLLKQGKTDERIKLTGEGQKDIKNLEPFYRQKNSVDNLEKLKKAEAVPEQEYDVVILSKKFIEDNEPQLAILTAQTATEMDATYRDAWLYLGIAHFKTIEKVELTAENRSYHKEKALEALNKARALDATYQPTLDFLKEAENIK